MSCSETKEDTSHKLLSFFWTSCCCIYSSLIWKTIFLWAASPVRVGLFSHPALFHSREPSSDLWPLSCPRLTRGQDGRSDFILNEGRSCHVISGPCPDCFPRLVLSPSISQGQHWNLDTSQSGVFTSKAVQHFSNKWIICSMRVKKNNLNPFLSNKIYSNHSRNGLRNGFNAQHWIMDQRP